MKPTAKLLLLALGQPGQDVDARVFGKPVTHINRRMAVMLAAGKTTDDAVRTAAEAARRITIAYD